MILLGDAKQFTGGRVGPRMKRTDEPTPLSTRLFGQACTAMSARIQECFEFTGLVTRCQYRNAEVINREPSVRFRQVTRQPYELWVF